MGLINLNPEQYSGELHQSCESTSDHRCGDGVRERIIQTLRAAREEDGAVAPSPAVSLMERASTIRALPLLPEAGPEVAGVNGADGKAAGKQASLPQLEDAAKVGAGCCSCA